MQYNKIMINSKAKTYKDGYQCLKSFKLHKTKLYNNSVDLILKRITSILSTMKPFFSKDVSTYYSK